MINDDMNIPHGKTCGDCAHFGKCSWLVSAKPEWTSCDFYPIRFRPRDERGKCC